MNGLIRWFATNHVAANLLMVVIMAAGLMSAMNIKQEVFPEVEMDIVSTQVTYPGASPAEVEQAEQVEWRQRVGRGEILDPQGEGLVAHFDADHQHFVKRVEDRDLQQDRQAAGGRIDLFRLVQLQHFLLQPRDDEHAAQHLRATLAYCMQHPNWRLSLQTHKIIGID